jgi:hypothetical protein
MHLPGLFASLPDDRVERLRRVALFVEAWWGPLGPDDGVPEDELRAAEKRLGVPLPAAMREAYARLGQRVEIVSAFDQLVSPRRLRRKDGRVVLWHLDDANEWFVRERDLGLPDPPLFVRDRDHGRWHEHPALPRDPSFSRFFVWKALDQATAGCRYGNSVDMSPRTDPPDALDALAAEVARRFTLLDFGTVEHPPPASRLYGGEDVLIAVRDGATVKVSAPSLEAYRRAMEALRAVPSEWHAKTDAEAFNGEFADHQQGLDDMSLLLHAAYGSPPLRAEAEGDRHAAPAPASAPPRADDRAIGSAGDLDPRLGLLITNALAPYSALLPPPSVEHLRDALELVVETWPRSHADVLLGKPATDDVAPVRRQIVLAPELEAKAQALGLTPEQRDQVDAVLASGMIDDVVGAVRRRFAQMDARAGDPGVEVSDEEALDGALVSMAEEGMHRFLLHMPDEEPVDRDACEADLSRILRLGAASMFAGICGALLRGFQGGKAPRPRYLRAVLVTRKLPSAGQDARLFGAYYLHPGKIADVAERLGVPVDLEYERHRAYLDRVTATVEAIAAQLAQAGRGAFEASTPIGDLLALLKPRDEPEPTR